MFSKLSNENLAYIVFEENNFFKIGIWETVIAWWWGQPISRFPFTENSTYFYYFCLYLGRHFLNFSFGYTPRSIIMKMITVNLGRKVIIQIYFVATK